MWANKLLNSQLKARFAIMGYSKCYNCFTSYVVGCGTTSTRTLLGNQPPPHCVRLINTTSGIPPQITKALESINPAQNTELNVDSIVSTIGPIPEAPSAPLPPVFELLPNGEPSLASLGLDSWWPNGLFQKALEYVHVTGDLPWWASIVVVTAIVRIVLFPIVVKQLNANIKFGNNMPQFMVLQSKMIEARSQNDHLTAATYGLELQEFMKEKNVNPLSVLKFTWVQAFVLISFTSGLRKMCALPVESLQTGGLLHILDLTATDPTYILPLANAAVIFTNLKLGVDIPRTMSTNQYVIYGMQFGIPAAVFIGTSFMYNSIGIYWLSTGLIALIQNRLIRLPKVRKYLNLENERKGDIAKQMQEIKDMQKQKKKKNLGFIANIRAGMDNSRIANEIKHRAELDEVAFERAGREPIRKTYKYNPKEVAAKKN